MKLLIEVTSITGGQIPVLGTFEAGETKVIDEDTQGAFERAYGHKVAAGNYGGASKCSVTVLQDEPTEDSTEVEEKGEEA
jgi:hypothetical protein